MENWKEKVRKFRFFCRISNNLRKAGYEVIINNIIKISVDVKYKNKVKFKYRIEFTNEFSIIKIKSVIIPSAMFSISQFISFLSSNV